jgi:hypothetical protein
VIFFSATTGGPKHARAGRKIAPFEFKDDIDTERRKVLDQLAAEAQEPRMGY